MTKNRLAAVSCILCLSLALSCGRDPDRALSSYISGKEAFAGKNLEAAEKHFSEALKLDASLHNARLMLAKVYYYGKNFGAALSEVERILKADRDHPGALYWKARIAVINPADGANDNAAISLLARVLELDAHHIPARSLLALLYEKNRKYHEALREYRIILSEEESLIDARANLSVLYHRLGLKDRALAEIDRAIKICAAGGRNGGRLNSIKKEMAE